MRLGNLRTRSFVESVMRSRLIALFGLAAFVWSAISIPNPPAASACSCGPPPPLVSFEGTALNDGEAVEADAPFGENYEFRVERVIEGDVRPSERVRVVAGAGSMCGIGPGLLRRGRYRINASVSAPPGGGRVLNVNLCSGSAELLAAPAEDETSETDRWPVVVATALAAATAGIILRRRRHLPRE